jgi:hypothetical protein
MLKVTVMELMAIMMRSTEVTMEVITDTKIIGETQHMETMDTRSTIITELMPIITAIMLITRMDTDQDFGREIEDMVMRNTMLTIRN